MCKNSSWSFFQINAFIWSIFDAFAQYLIDFSLEGSDLLQVNPLQPKVFEVKLSLREIESIFFIEIHNFKLWRMSK